MSAQDTHELVVAIVALLGALTSLASIWLHWLQSGMISRHRARLEQLENRSRRHRSLHGPDADPPPEGMT